MIKTLTGFMLLIVSSADQQPQDKLKVLSYSNDAEEVALFLFDADPVVRGRAAERLGQLGAGDYRGAIGFLATSDCKKTRFMALSGIAHLKVKGYSKQVKQFFDDKSLYYSDFFLEQMIWVAGELEVKEVEDYLLRLLESRSGRIKTAVIRALAQIDSLAYTDKFLEIVKSETNKETIQAAAEGITNNNPKSVEAIAKLLECNDRQRLTIAISTLGRLKVHKYAGQIVSFLKHEDMGVQRSALNALAQMGANEFIKEIILFFKTENGLRLNATIVGALTDLLKHNPKEHIKYILELLSDPIPTRRIAAIQILTLTNQRMYAPLIARMMDVNNAGTYRVCEEAIRAIGILGDQSYKDKLESITSKYPNSPLKIAALQALQQLDLNHNR